MLNEGGTPYINLFYTAIPGYKDKYKPALESLDEMCRVFYERFKDKIEDGRNKTYIRYERVKNFGNYYIYARPLMKYFDDGLFTLEEIKKFYEQLSVLFDGIKHLKDNDGALLAFGEDFYERMDELERFLKRHGYLLVEQ